MSGNLTIEFCQFVSSNEIDKLSTSCPVSGFFTQDSLKGLMLYSAQIGYSNGHLLLAVIGFFLSIASLINVGLFYRRMVGSSEWSSFNDYQKFHIKFHVLVILFSISWISGFALYIMNSQVYIFMSALSESLVYLIQIIISVIVIRLWMESEQIRLHMQPFLWGLLLPAAVYVVSVAFYVGSSENSTVIARVASVVMDIMNVARFLIAISSFLFSIFIKDTTFVDYNIFFLNGTMSFATVIYSILSIVFTVGICPITDHVSIRFFEWYYFIAWILLDLYFSLTFQKVSRQTQLLLQSAYNLSLHEPRNKVDKVQIQPAKAQTTQNYVTPLRRFFGELPSLPKKHLDQTLDGSDIMNLLTERQNKIKRYYSIASWCGCSLGLILIAYYLFAIYYLFGNERGLIHSIIITVCITLVSHFIFGGLSLTPTNRTRFQSFVSIGLGVFYFIVSILAIVLSGDLSIYIAAYLWPICTILVALDFSRHNPDKNVSPIIPDIPNLKIETSRSSESFKRQISYTIQWSFFRYLALTVLCGSFFISLVSGLYLPLSVMVVILVSSISISGYLPSNRLGYFSALSLLYIIVLAVSIILAFISPIFWGKTASGHILSHSFVQKDYTSISYSSSFTDSQGIYLAFEATKRKSDNYLELKSWLDSLPPSKNRIYFEIQDNLELMKNIGWVFCSNNYRFSPFFITKSIPLMVYAANLGLGKSFVGLKYGPEAQVLNDLSIDSDYFSSVFDFRSIFLNPFLLTSSLKRNIHSIVIFDKNEETDQFIQLTILAGASFDILNQAERASSQFPPTQVITNLNAVVPTLSESIKEIAAASSFAAWLIGCLTIPVLIACLLILYWVYGFFVKLPVLRLQERRIIFGKMITLEKAIQQVMILVAVVGFTGWIIFAVGGASYTYSGNNVLSLEGMTYLLAIFGSSSCILNYVSAMHKNVSTVLTNIFLLIVSLLGAGSSTFFGFEKIAIPGIRLMVIGAVVYSVFQAIGCGISSSRQMRSSLEIDNVVRICSAFSLIGWNLALISVGRLKTDFNRDIEPMMIGLTVSGIFANVFLFLSTIQFNQWITSFGVSLATISIFFIGGAIVSTGTELSHCSNLTCSYHIPLLFAGECIYFVGCIAGLFARMLSFETTDDVEARIISQMQIDDYQDDTTNELDPKGIINVLEPLRETQNIFMFLTKNPYLWNIWRGFGVLALVCWIIFLSGFGSLADEFAPADFSTAAILYSLFGPVSVFAQSWALIRNSRGIMSFAIAFSIISTLTCGRIICVTWLNPFSAKYSIIIGCSGFIISMIVMFALILFKFGVKFKDNFQLAAPKTFYVSAIVFAFLGTILINIGVLVRSDSKDLQDVRASYADSFLSFVMGYISVLAMSVLLYILFTSTIIDGEMTFRPIFSLVSVLSVVFTFGSLISNGSMMFTSSIITSRCSNETCSTGLSPNLLILVGSLLYAISCFLYLCTTILFGEPVKQENPAPPNPEIVDEEIEEMNIELYSMVMSWPSMQHWLKSCINLYIWSYFIFILSFSYLIGIDGLNSKYSATLPFFALGFISIVQLILWVLRGSFSIQYAGLSILIYNSGTTAFAFCWAIFGEHLGYKTPIILSSLLNIIVCAFILSGYMSWFSFTKKSISISSHSRTSQIISLIGWILFVVGFILQFSEESKITPDMICSWIFIILGFILFGFYVMITWETPLSKKIGYFWLSVTLSFGISVFIFGIISLASNLVQSSYVLKVLGSLLFFLSSVIFILHKSYYGRLILSKEEIELLLWKDRMSPFERPLHWIRQTHFSQFLNLYFIGVIITLAGMFALCASFIVLKLNANLVFSYILFISSVLSIISHLFFTYYRWQSFGWSFIFSLMLSLTVSGPAIASIMSSSNSGAGAYGVIAGCGLSLLGQILAFFVLISRSNISEQRWFQLIIKVLIVALCLSWIVALVALVIGTKLTAAYFIASFPGVFSIIYLIFVYIWRPKVPKVKSLAEWLGYTIVKKSDLRDALKKANEEHIEVNNITEDSELSKNPIFGKFKPKKKSVPLIERRTINESIDALFGSQPVSVAIALISALVYGIVAYDAFHYFIIPSDGTVTGYLYALSALVALLSYNAYILIVGITAFIDESRLKDSPLKSEESLSSPEAKKNPSIVKSSEDPNSNYDMPDDPKLDTSTEQTAIINFKTEDTQTTPNSPNQEAILKSSNIATSSNTIPSKLQQILLKPKPETAFQTPAPHTDFTSDHNVPKKESGSLALADTRSKPFLMNDDQNNNLEPRISSKWIRNPDDSQIAVEDF